MKNQNKQFKIHPSALTVALVVLLLLGNSFQQTAAQVAGGGKVPYPFLNATVETNNLCEPEMQKFADGELADFRSFLETNFQNKSSTSSLTTVALGKYREMRDEFNTAYARYSPQFGSIQDMTGLQHNQCKVIIDDALSTARTLLKRHAMRTAGVKKSTALLEKYQQINAELADLYQQFIFMKAYLDTFSNKLSCYPKTGCLKG